MEQVSINALRDKKVFIENIRWDVTPKIFVSPGFSQQELESERARGGKDEYMLYIDSIHDKHVLMIMKLRYSYSTTVAYVTDIPADLLLEATNCPPEECIEGMFPLSKKLEDWLKKELGLS